MGVIIRQSFKSSASMYLGAVIGIANRLFLLPKYLSPAQIGLIDLLLIVSLFFSSISSLGVIGSLVKFYNRHKVAGTLPQFIGYLVLIALLGYILTSILLVIFKNYFIEFYYNDTALISDYYILIIPLTFIFIIKGFFSNYSLTNQRATIPSIIGDILPKLTLTFLVIFLGFQLILFPIFVNLMVVSYLVFNVILIIYCYNQFNLKIRFNLKKITKSDKEKITKYSFFVLLSGMSGYVAQFIDTAMVGSMKGLEWAGIYSIAFFLGLSIEMPKRAISGISLPIIVKHFDNLELHKINRLYKQSSINQGIVGGLFLLLIITNINEIFYLIPNSEKYEIGKNVAIIIGLSRWVDMITGINSEILRSSKYYFWDLITVAMFILISIGSNIYLIPRYGLEGAAIASLTSIIFYNLVRIIVLYRLFKFTPFTLNTIKLLVALILIIIINFIFPFEMQKISLQRSLFSIAIKSVFVTICFISYVYLTKISPEVNSLLTRLLPKSRHH